MGHDRPAVASRSSGRHNGGMRIGCLALLALLLATPARAEELSADAKRLIKRAEALEAKAANARRELRHDLAEEHALAAIDLKRRAVKGDLTHPALASAYVTLADVMLIRMSEVPHGEAWYEATTSLPAQAEAPILSLYQRAVTAYEREASEGNSDAIATIALRIAGILQSRDLLIPCARWVHRAFQSLGKPTDVESRERLDRGLYLLFNRVDQLLDASNRFAFFGAMTTLDGLRPYAERLVALHEESGTASTEGAQAHRYLAALGLGDRERIESALAHAEKAIALFKGLDHDVAFDIKLTQRTMAALLLDAGRLEDARAAYPHGLAMGPDDASCLPTLERQLGIVATGADEGLSAREIVERIVFARLGHAGQIPSWPYTPRSILRRMANEQVRGHEKSPDAQAVAGLARLAVGDLPEAQAHYEAALAAAPRDKAAGHAAIAYVACLRSKFDVARDHAGKAYTLACPKGVPAEGKGLVAALNYASLLHATGATEEAQGVLDGVMEGMRSKDAVRLHFQKNERWRLDPIVALLRELGRDDDVIWIQRRVPYSDLYLSEDSPAEPLRLEGKLRESLAAEREHYNAYARHVGDVETLRTYDWSHRVLRRTSLLLDLGLEDEALAELLDVLESFNDLQRMRGLSRVRSQAPPILLRSMEHAARALMRRGQLDQGLALARRAYGMHTGYEHLPDRRLAPPLDRHPQHLLVERVLSHIRPSLPPLASRAPEVYARALLATDEPERAVAIMAESVALLRTRVRADSPRLGLALHALASIELTCGKVEPARAHVGEALRILEQGLDPQHPFLADVAVTAGDVEVLSQQPAEAHAYYDRSLAIAEASLAPSHAVFPMAWSGKALAHSAQGAHPEAVASMRKALERIATRIESAFVGATHGEQMAMRASVQWALANWLLITRAAGEVGYEEVLLLKARVAHSMADEIRVVREMRASKGKGQKAAEALDTARRKLARVSQRAPRFGWKRAAWRRRVAEAAEQVAKHTKALARSSREFAQSRKPPAVGASALAKRLKGDEALVDILLAGGRFTAWILTKGKNPVRVELGSEAEITPTLQAFRDAVREVESVQEEAYRTTGRAVVDVIWKPLAAHLPETTNTLYVVPDGPLAALPLQALPLANDACVLDRYLVVRLASARDLLPRSTKRKSKGILLVGAVDFNNVARETQGPVVTGQHKQLKARVPSIPAFPFLPGTKDEIAWLETHYKRKAPSVPRVVLSGDKAGESRVREAAVGKAVLHFATHGFVRDWLNVQLRVPEDEALRLRGGLERHTQSFDPFLMSGLALSGVNARVTEGLDDGMLTALEVLGFDLEGTQLAFLSACDTARGIEQAGEGVIGLVGSFTLAGVHQVVASLWPVDDAATSELVKQFYGEYVGKGRTAAAASLRKAALGLRGDERFQAPRHWAAFGAYGPLR